MSNSLAKYEEFKDSGVDGGDLRWVGEIPEYWKIIKLKNICKINECSLSDDTNRDLAFEYVDIGNVSFEKGVLQTESMIFKNAPSRARRIAKSGDTIVSTVRTYLKAIDYIDDDKSDFVYSTGFAILSPKNVYPRYLTMAIRSDSFTNQVDIRSTGMSYPAINSTELGRLKIAIPSLPEQTAIANFLDRKTAQIDQAISIKEKQIELLKERRQILIHNAVTRGLDPAVRMKDSGVELLGQIPEHWQMKKLKYLLAERVERSETGNETLFMVSQTHGLVIRADFHDKAEVAQSSVGSKKVYFGDLVFNKLKAHLGVFFKSTIQEVGIVSPDYAVYYPIGGMDDLKFLELLFRQPAYINQFICKATGIVEGLIRLYTGDLFSLKVPLPEADEQKAILEYVQNINQKIATAISLKQKEIEKLKEYKSTLINSAVTGKIKV